MTTARKARIFDGMIEFLMQTEDPQVVANKLRNYGMTEKEVNELTRPLRVCEHCLMAIESHEGNQHARRIYVDEEDPTESRCDWCEEDGFDMLYEI